MFYTELINLLDRFDFTTAAYYHFYHIFYRRNTIKKEHNAVLEIVKFGNKKTDKLLEILEDKTLNWIEILGYLCYHRVAGLAYEVINSINIRKLDFPVFLQHI